MSPLMQQLEATAGFIQSKITTKANTAIILGSGLGNLSSVIEADFSIPFVEMETTFHDPNLFTIQCP